MGERHGAGAAFAFVLEGNVLLPQDGGILNCCCEEGKSPGDPALGILTVGELDAAIGLEDGAGVDHALLLVSEEGNGYKEDGKLDLAVFLVAGLFNLHGHVGAFVFISEGEDCTAGEEEVGE